MFLSYLTLFVALSLSAIAAFYSIAGLAAIFAAAVIPIVVMGSVLEVAKLVVTVWLHEYWHQCKRTMKVYLVPAVGMLMLITSMGIFGFLSKAHMDQTLVSGDVGAKISIYDEKIRTAKDNIDTNRRALKQMDEAVDQVMGRSNDEKGADKAVAIRRSQQKERARLQSEIATEQKTIAALNEESAPIRAEVRKVEAEVGPIKYIAALIYGDNPDANILEKAVRWVIIILVCVFDPLAVMMLLAATESIGWERMGIGRKRYQPKLEEETVETDKPKDSKFKFNWPTPWGKKEEPVVEDELDNLEPVFDDRHTHIPVEDYYAFIDTTDDKKPTGDITSASHFGLDKEPEISASPEDEIPLEAFNTTEVEDEHPFKGQGQAPSMPLSASYNQPVVVEETTEEEPEVLPELAPIVNDAVVIEHPEPPMGDEVEHWGYHPAVGKVAHKPTELWKDQLEAKADDELSFNNADFGTEFPKNPQRGDAFIRVDYLPTKLYKWNGVKWIEVDKETTDAFTYNDEYIEHLIQKIASGEYDPDMLNTGEREEIERKLRDDTNLTGNS
jgi:hypothetical protein